jgi:hypothetical protein
MVLKNEQERRIFDENFHETEQDSCEEKKQKEKK